jgi:alpha-galactosidase
MAMLCHAMQRETAINVTGLCHSVQGTAAMIAGWLGIRPDKLDYVCAGINHMAWYTKLEYRGRDQYPKLKRVISTDRAVYNQEQVRNEMFLALGAYVTESSGHNSEYNWWFRKRPDLISKYCKTGSGWNPGHHAYILTEYRRRDKTWKKEVQKWLDNDAPIELERGHEYAAYIINAFLGGEGFKFNGNVANTGLVTNLPQGACVEVPVLASRGRLEPIHVGRIPDACAILTNLSAQIEMMAVEGAMSGDRDLIFQAIAHDPLTASKLSLAEIRKMVDEMFRRNKRYLPQFKI